MGDESERIEKLVIKLQNPKANERYEACEWLRAAPAISSDAIDALRGALSDPNEDVADAAKRALAIHLTPSPSPEREELKIIPMTGMPISHNTPSREVRSQNFIAAPQMPSGSPNTPEYIFNLEKRIMILESELHRNSKEISELYSLFDTALNRIPESNLISNDYLKRSFAVWGHYFVAQLIISIPFICLYLLFIGLMINNQ